MGLRAQVQKDDHPYKKEIFAALLHASPWKKYIYQICASSPWLSLWCCQIFYYRKFAFLRVPRQSTFLAMPGFRNERKALDFIAAPDLPLQLVTKAWAGPFPFAKFWRRHQQRGRIFARLLRKQELFLVLRVAQFCAYLQKLQVAAPEAKGILLTTDSNPNGLALLLYAKKRAWKVAFLSHGQPNPPYFPLQCDLALLLGEASEKKYLAVGGKIGKTIFYGQKEKWRPVRVPAEIRQLGIFLGKVHEDAFLSKLVLWIQGHGAKALVRPHPTFPLRGGLAKKLRSLGARVSDQQDLAADLAACDFVLAGNTTSHLDILLGGKASLYFAESRDFDRYGYLSSGLVLAWKPGITIEEIAAFYKNSEERLRFHLCLDKNAEESRAEFRAALHCLTKDLSTGG